MARLAEFSAEFQEGEIVDEPEYVISGGVLCEGPAWFA